MKVWYSASDVIRQSELSESTARRYLNTFSAHFITQPKRKPRRYDDSAPQLLKQINELYSNGRSTEQINEFLAMRTPVIIDAEPEPQEDTATAAAVTITSIIDEIQAVNANINKVLDILAITIADNRTQRAEIEELKREIEEMKRRALQPPAPQEPPPAPPKTPRKSFWTRLFKGE